MTLMPLINISFYMKKKKHNSYYVNTLNNVIPIMLTNYNIIIYFYSIFPDMHIHDQ